MHNRLWLGSDSPLRFFLNNFQTGPKSTWDLEEILNFIYQFDIFCQKLPTYYSSIHRLPTANPVALRRLPTFPVGAGGGGRISVRFTLVIKSAGS